MIAKAGEECKAPLGYIKEGYKDGFMGQLSPTTLNNYGNSRKD